MDSLASLALATEPPKDSLLDRPPQSRDEYIISHKMVKHLLGMAIYQSIIIFGIIFAGEYIIPEQDDFFDEKAEKLASVGKAFLPEHAEYIKKGFIFPGRLFDWNGDDLYGAYADEIGSSRHLTVVFNSFVLMQIFNMINARKIHDEKNICVGIFDNYMFVIVFFIILVL